MKLHLKDNKNIGKQINSHRLKSIYVIFLEHHSKQPSCHVVNINMALYV